jgi:hypothetical protein
MSVVGNIIASPISLQGSLLGIRYFIILIEIA